MTLATESPSKHELVQEPHWAAVVFNAPNTVTWIRLGLSIVVFVLISLDLYLAAAILLAVTLGTDWVDGMLARKLNQITVLGRILDPLVDKVAICGSFIYLAAVPGSGIAPWMTVVVVSREMIVTALRSFTEKRGADFSADLGGKVKMIVQSIAAPVALLSVHLATVGGAPAWLTAIRDVTIWVSVLATVTSGGAYVFAAVRLAARVPHVHNVSKKAPRFPPDTAGETSSLM